MNELDEVALELCEKYGLDFGFSNDAADCLVSNGMNEHAAVDELIDRYGDSLFG